MAANDCEWKDWHWMKTQWRVRRPFWIWAMIGVVSGCVPVVPIVIRGGTLQGTLMWLPPFLLYVFTVPWLSPLLIAAHIAAIGSLGQFRRRSRG